MRRRPAARARGVGPRPLRVWGAPADGRRRARAGARRPPVYLGGAPRDGEPLRQTHAALEGFLAPREAKIRRGLGLAGRRLRTSGQESPAPSWRGPPRIMGKSSGAWRGARRRRSAFLMVCARALLMRRHIRRGRSPLSKAARRPRPRTKHVRADAADAAGPPHRRLRGQASGYLDDSGDETPTLDTHTSAKLSAQGGWTSCERVRRRRKLTTRPRLNRSSP